ncbi:UNVERIFIED_CONTAM: hypothetical protein Scaly_2937700, partial [Sesamum calycinum]
MRERRKKRKQEQQNKKGEGSSRGNEQWFSDCEDEELKSVRGSDDEGDGCPVWDERMDMGKVDLAVGMKFETRAKFRDVMRDWAVRRGWDLKLVKNEKHLILATCKNECNWKLRASSVMKSTIFQIKSIKGEQNCAHKVENKQANYKYIGKRLESFVRDNPNESLQSLKSKVRRELQIEVSDYKVYRAKKYALELIRGTPVFSQPSQDSQPKFQFSPCSSSPHVPAHDPPPQTAPETLLRVAGQHQMRLQLEDLMCINHHMIRLFIQRKVLNNLSNNNIHNPQEFI